MIEPDTNVHHSGASAAGFHRLPKWRSTYDRTSLALQPPEGMLKNNIEQIEYKGVD